jgi:hypothetical protein
VAGFHVLTMARAERGHSPRTRHFIPHSVFPCLSCGNAIYGSFAPCVVDRLYRVTLSKVRSPFSESSLPFTGFAPIV